MDPDRRRVVLVLIALAIAVPLLVEGYTLVKLVGGHFGGDETPTGAAPAATATSTVGSGVGPGDELLGETDRNETVTTATLSDGDVWTLTLTVSVENTGDSPYELRLGNVTTDQGRTVSKSATTGTVLPGERGTVTAQWELPRGDRPDTVAVTAFERRDGASEALVERDVRLASLPVRG